jgi:hypothetical protein
LDLQINKLFKNDLVNLRLSAVIRKMVLFLKMGEKVKKEFVCDNYYVNEFKKIYIKLLRSSTSIMKNLKNLKIILNN